MVAARRHRREVELLQRRPRHRDEQLGGDAVTQLVDVARPRPQVAVLQPVRQPLPGGAVAERGERHEVVGAAGAVREVEEVEEPGVVALGERRHPTVADSGFELLFVPARDPVDLVQQQHGRLPPDVSGRRGAYAGSRRSRRRPGLAARRRCGPGSGCGTKTRPGRRRARRPGRRRRRRTRVDATKTPGCRRLSRFTMSCTLHDVHEPQSASASITTSHFVRDLVAQVDRAPASVNVGLAKR